ncbi:hypothetical protein CR492_01675 [Methylocella silvestris]|uniref:Uncharacterized protein n=1 Tax=Methylocella silvestris TaxID=199596 RepID=A0A2J7TLL0_METSI|nr:hypothetical protein CR492_01675 [Methylocella silvestris]
MLRKKTEIELNQEDRFFYPLFVVFEQCRNAGRTMSRVWKLRNGILDNTKFKFSSDGFSAGIL